jgi:hypothetical protein
MTTPTKAEQLADELNEPQNQDHANRLMARASSELRRLSPMEAERDALKARVMVLEAWLKIIAHYGNSIDVDCGDIARTTLAKSGEQL